MMIFHNNTAFCRIYSLFHYLVAIDPSWGFLNPFQLHAFQIVNLKVIHVHVLGSIIPANEPHKLKMDDFLT